MKTFYSLVFYMAIGGFIYGLAHNAASDKCGKPLPVTTESTISAMAWPTLIAIVLIAEDSINSEYSCED